MQSMQSLQPGGACGEEGFDCSGALGPVSC
jgi:hypothetical protein